MSFDEVALHLLQFLPRFRSFHWADICVYQFFKQEFTVRFRPMMTAGPGAPVLPFVRKLQGFDHPQHEKNIRDRVCLGSGFVECLMDRKLIDSAGISVTHLVACNQAFGQVADRVRMACQQHPPSQYMRPLGPLIEIMHLEDNSSHDKYFSSMRDLLTKRSMSRS
jgi:hypothetical protein